MEAKWVEFTESGSDRSFTGQFTWVLSVLQCLKESKEKKRMNEKRRNTMKIKKRNIEE